MNWEKELAICKEESAQRREVIKKIRSSHKYDEWRKKVVRRDEYTCQECSKQIFLGLHAHHEKSLFEIVNNNEIITFREALDCKELWDMDNGKSLCMSCHFNIKAELQKKIDRLI